MMKCVAILMCLLVWMAVPVSALEYAPPAVPESGRNTMPEKTDSFGEGVLELAETALSRLMPELKQAAGIGGRILCIVLLVSILQQVSGSAKTACELAGNLGICISLVECAGTMITLGMETVEEITAYGKLLLPVLTGALAAQGGIGTSAALYAGTALFNSLLSSCIASVLIPGVRLFLAVAMVGSITGEEILKRLSDGIKSGSIWILKTLLMVFTTYLGITGVVSGTTDAAALKAARVAISSVVPVVGGILSDASEAVLVSAAIAKNAAGIYGILAVLAVVVRPFVRLMSHYLVLKLTAAVCSVFGSKGNTALIDAFSAAMGILLAITAACCVMVLISTVCFLRSVQ